MSNTETKQVTPSCLCVRVSVHPSNSPPAGRIFVKHDIDDNKGWHLRIKRHTKNSNNYFLYVRKLHCYFVVLTHVAKKISYTDTQNEITNKTENKPLQFINPLNAKLNPICHLVALERARHILYFNKIELSNPRKT